MKSVDLAKAFYTTKAILESEGLWLKDGTEMSVDYALAQSIVVSEEPDSYDLKFSVDFGGSEGIYVSMILLLWFDNDSDPTKFDFGTIKTLADTRDAFAAYAALGANFVYYARKEIAKLLGVAFPTQKVHYEVHCLKEVMESIEFPSMKVAEITEKMEKYYDKYEKVHDGEFWLFPTPSNLSLCSYLLEKSKMELAYPLNMGDVLVLEFTFKNHPEKYTHSYIYDGLDNGKSSFTPVHFHEYLEKEEVCVNG